MSRLLPKNLGLAFGWMILYAAELLGLTTSILVGGLAGAAISGVAMALAVRDRGAWSDSLAQMLLGANFAVTLRALVGAFVTPSAFATAFAVLSFCVIATISAVPTFWCGERKGGRSMGVDGSRLAVASPPGAWLLRLGDCLVRKSTLRLITEMVADMRTEYCDLLLQGRSPKARWIKLLHYLSIARALSLDRVLAWVADYFVGVIRTGRS